MCPIRFATALLRLMGLVHPSWAAAQAAGTSTVTVTVRATSHAVLRRVTNSPLIEGSRSATIHETGRYSIVNLRPGTSAVTFTLPGWELGEENL